MGIRRLFKIYICLNLLFSAGIVAGQTVQKQPRIMSIGADEQMELTLNPQGKKLLGLFVTYDTAIQTIIVSDLAPFSTWIDGRLSTDIQDFHSLEMSELYLDRNESDTIFISFFSEQGFEQFKCEFVYANLVSDVTDSPIRIKDIKYNKETFVVMLIFFFLILAIFRFTSGDSLFSYFSKVFFRNIRISIFEHDSNTTYLEILLASLLSGMAVWHIKNGQDVYYSEYMQIEIVNYLQYCGIALLLLIGKFVIIRTVAYLNGLGGIYLIQFVDFLKYLLISSIILNVLFFSFYWSQYYPAQYISGNWEYIYPLLYLMFAVYYFFKLSSAVTGKKLLIISYLCTTEILGAYIVASILIN